MSDQRMSHCNKIGVLSSLVIFSACSSKTANQAAKLENDVKPDSTVLAARQGQRKDSAIANEITCVRGQAEPIAKKKYFPATSFVLQPDSITGVEIVSFKNGDKLKITNWGCESYVLTFRFETSRFKADSSNLKYWYAAANKLMSEALPGIDAPLDIKAGVRALNSYAAKNARHLKLRTELIFSGDEAVRVVSLDTVANVQRSRMAVVLSFTAGLL